MSDMKEDNSIVLTFDNNMQQVPISLSDLAIEIFSESRIKYDWSATFTSSRTLTIKFMINSALQGGEKMEVKLINHKVLRSPSGG